MATANALGEKLAKAPAADKDRLAEWQLAGARGPRPEPTVEPIEQELRVARADLEALTGAIHRTLGEKAEYVAKHRKRLVKDAAKAKEEVYARAVRLVEELEQARVELLEARDAEIWAHLYPGEVATDVVQYKDALIGARMEPLKRILGLTTQLPVRHVFAALRADADYARDAASPAQRRELAGRRHAIRAALSGRTRRRARRRSARSTRPRLTACETDREASGWTRWRSRPLSSTRRRARMARRRVRR